MTSAFSWQNSISLCPASFHIPIVKEYQYRNGCYCPLAKRHAYPGKDHPFIAAKDGEALYSQQKQDQELTVAHIIHFLLPNSD